MKDLSDVTVCVFDGGLFVELASIMARKCKRVLYQCSANQRNPKLHEACIGDGIDGFDCIRDFWDYKEEIDLFIIPDCAHAGLQKELRSQGFPVWGSGEACELELDRLAFKRQLKAIGLEVGPYAVITGLSNLRKHLADKEDKWIKISRYRGCRETWHWIDQKTSDEELDALAMMFGSLREQMMFIVEDAIETEVEWGYDGYFCGGKFPTLSAHGPEIKDQCYLSAIVDWNDLPDQVREVNEAMAPVLKRMNYNNAYSAEIRITKEGVAYFTDPTCRFPWPASAAQMELYANLPEIIWHGSNGECIDPEPTAKFAAECLITHKGEEKNWRKLVVPDAFRQWVKLYDFCQLEPEVYAFPPFPHSCETIGSVIGIGDSIEEALDHLKENTEALSGQPVEIRIESLADGLKELRSAEEQGIEFTKSEEIPEPAEVL